MRFELINNVKENEIIGRTIFDKNGRPLLKKGVKITSSYIQKLKDLGVLYIYLKDDRLNDIVVEDNELQSLKQDTMYCLSKVIRNIGAITQSHIKDCVNSVSEMIDYIMNMRDINKSLYEIKTHDNYTMLHSVDTGANTAFIGLALGFNKDMLNELVIGGTLHDIGKLKIPISIIDKKGPLTEDEYNEIKRHTIYGVEVLKGKHGIPKSALRTILEHHEKLDGTGYPYGMKDKEISINAKITSVCDVFDALTSDRSYRKKFNPTDAYELILSEAGRSFDERVVTAFKETFSIFPVGSCVRLSNGIEGYVIKQNQGFPDRPIIRILYDAESKQRLSNYYEIDLLDNTSIVITMIL
ncbi:HD-GYP domain-containing protein [Clostridium ihumii]|uniref:HD-GYP domain-containing protein n=1 Tax=Clostridium ihumii TaxID=1470356 RepID=UPI000590CB88|nr:HD-GYP domain-containing protein [Clostridium ihumii]